MLHSRLNVGLPIPTHRFYKSCIVPQCNNTSKRTPHKLFINVPKSKTVRDKWLTLAGRENNLSSCSTVYYCEDHFDLPNDMLNYSVYKIMGTVTKILMKPDCYPSKFTCQTEQNKSTSDEGQHCKPFEQVFIKSENMIASDPCVIELSSSESEEESPPVKKTKFDNTNSDVILLIDDDDCVNVTATKEPKDLKANGQTVSEPPNNKQYKKEVLPLEEEGNNLETPSLVDDKSEVSTNSDAELSHKSKSDISASSNKRVVCNELDSFFKLCLSNLKNERTLARFNEKLLSVRKRAGAASEYLKTEEFKTLLAKFTKEISDDSNKVINVFFQLNSELIKNKNVPNSEEIESKLDYYYDFLSKLEGKINEFAEEEVDLEDEEGSSYLKYQKYQEKAASVIKKIRSLEGRDEHHGVAYYSPLNFARSKYHEFNLALNRKYADRTKRPFPTLCDVDKCLRRVAKKNNLEIPEPVLKSEIKVCFEELGKLIQMKRKNDLAKVHVGYLPNLNEDPARDDEELKRKLDENRSLAEAAEEEILSKFTAWQEGGYVESDNSNATESEADSDDSSVKAGST